MTLPPPLVLPLPQGSGDLSASLSATGDQLAVGRGQEVLVYDLSGPAPTERHLGQVAESSYTRPRFAPDGALWAGLHRLDAAGAWTQLLHLPDDRFSPVGDLAFLPDRRIARQALGPDGHVVALFAPQGDGYALQRLTEPKRLPHDAVLAVAPDGTTLALSLDYVHVFDTSTGKAWKRLPGHKVYHGAFACFCDEGLLFTRDPPGSSYFDKRYHVQLMVRKGKRVFEEGRTFELAGVTAPHGLRVACGRLFGIWEITVGRTAVRIWDLATGEVLVEDEVEASLRSLAVSADGGTWAAPTWSSVYVFRVR